MAHVTTSAPAATGASGWFGGFFDGILEGLARLAEANPKVRQMKALAALSDAQLAERGLRREEIARYVFRDRMYL